MRRPADPSRLPESASDPFCFVRNLPWRPGSPVASVLHKNYAIDMHTHEFLEINIVLRGRGRHYIEGASAPVAAGDVFVIPSMVRHGYRGGRGLDVYHFLLHPEFVRRGSEAWRALPGFLMFFTVEPYFRKAAALRSRLRLGARERADVAATLKNIEDELTRGRPGWPLVVEGLATGLIVFLCRRYAKRCPPSSPERSAGSPLHGLQAALERMADAYAERWTLQGLADLAHMERHYFCRVFRRVLGVTPLRHLFQVRVEAAKRLLRETDWSVTRIAHEAGFYDGPHFSRVFARQAGLSPRAYRRRSVARGMASESSR